MGLTAIHPPLWLDADDPEGETSSGVVGFVSYRLPPPFGIVIGRTASGTTYAPWYGPGRGVRTGVRAAKA